MNNPTVFGQELSYFESEDEYYLSLTTEIQLVIKKESESKPIHWVAELQYDPGSVHSPAEAAILAQDALELLRRVLNRMK